ncbi:heavy metal-binding domain-containing protein [Marinicella meishanensis]|uniref:heavy metal-binding domain-containing protein n=1 Tax=Marinicella meishanensis TaxID=2873263 RepID=UPI001CBD560A|nr:heavy metal-binding domain-containing protein [Marinicella sp. NBU2979]
MIISTTHTLQGRTIESYCGLVAGESILGANIFRDLFGKVRDIVGGRSSAYEKVMAEARQQAIEELRVQAQKLGANAVIGIDVDYEVIGETGSMMMVSAIGTAVKVSA